MNKKELNAKVIELEATVSSLKSDTSMLAYYRKLQEESKKELEDLHSLLDTLEGALGRESPSNCQYSGNITHSCMTRLSSWFASRMG